MREIKIKVLELVLDICHCFEMLKPIIDLILYFQIFYIVEDNKDSKYSWLMSKGEVIHNLKYSNNFINGSPSDELSLHIGTSRKIYILTNNQRRAILLMNELTEN